MNFKDLENVEWRDISDFENLYQISNKGERLEARIIYADTFEVVE